MYIVMGTCGEYSDRMEFPLCATKTEKEAIEIVNFLDLDKQKNPEKHGEFEEGEYLYGTEVHYYVGHDVGLVTNEQFKEVWLRENKFIFKEYLYT